MYLLLNLIMKKWGSKYTQFTKYTCKKKKNTYVTISTAVILILERIKLYFSRMWTSNS